MSLSTTSTTAYILSKYSRASPASSTSSSSEEWQHFTNPTIRLILEMRKSASGDLESYRCRVLWTLNTGGDSMNVDQNEITFEDLELLSFSSSAVMENNKQIFAVHGLPLKAVYRDAIVGIRYLHPRVVPAGATPTYRRFQMNFQKISDASSFVEAIRPVCPCKANPPAAPTRPNRAMTMAMPRASAPVPGSMPPPEVPASKQTLRPAATMQLPSHAYSKSANGPDVVMGDETQTQQTQHTNPQSRTRDCAASSLSRSLSYAPGINSSWPLQHEVTDTPQAFASSSSDPIQARNAMRTNDLPVLASLPVSAPQPAPAPVPTAIPLSGSGSLLVPSPILPTIPPLIGPQTIPDADMLYASTGYSQFLTTMAPTINSDIIPPQADFPTRGVVQVDAAQPNDVPNSASLLSSLHEIPDLYNLSRSDLESLVARVVREDGFADLLRTLESMWKINVFLGPPTNASSGRCSDK